MGQRARKPNLVDYALYAALYAGVVAAGLVEIYFSLFFPTATDACHDAGCDAAYHVGPAMLTMAVGVGTVLLATLAGMVVGARRGRSIVGWPIAALPALGVVYAVAVMVLH